MKYFIMIIMFTVFANAETRVFEATLYQYKKAVIMTRSVTPDKSIQVDTKCEIRVHFIHGYGERDDSYDRLYGSDKDCKGLKQKSVLFKLDEEENKVYVYYNVANKASSFDLWKDGYFIFDAFK